MKVFKEAPDTKVIVSKDVLSGHSPILIVAHFEDGFWQFSGEEIDLPDEEYVMVTLEEIIKLDDTVLEVADLPFNAVASRGDAHSDWMIE